MSLRLERGQDSTGRRVSIGQLLDGVLGPDAQIRITAFDGSSAGPDDAPYSLHLATERGLSYLLTAPGELGLARAYVAGDLTVTGTHPADPYDFLTHLEDHVTLPKPSVKAAVELVRNTGVRS